VVLDPFSGASTVLLVARDLRRYGIGVEASPAYLALSRERLGLTALAAWEGTAVPVAPVVTYTDLPLFQ
jgi:DNA modification methylase